MAGLINGRYAIERPLGGGAEGDVFLATDRLRGEQVALKVIGASPRGSDAARLRAEFRRLSRLGHSRLLAVRDLDTVDDAVDGIAAGSLFFTSDYLAGDDLAGFARRRPGSEALLGVLEDIASALDHLHGAGLLHCDVKPENIRVIDPERGRAVLIDLGLALHRAAGGREARGTPAFMDRRALAGNPDVQSDLHGLGAAFYAALIGAPPFPHRDLGALIAALDRGPPIGVGERRPDLEPGIAALIDQLVDDDRRPSSARVVLELIAQRREALGLPVSDSTRAAGASPLPRLRLVGRRQVVAALDEALASVAAGDGPALIRVVGEPGTGRGAAIDRAADRRQLAASAGAPAIELLRGDDGALLDSLGGPLTGAPTAGDRSHAPVALAVDRALAGLAERARRRPVALILSADPEPDPRSRELVRALAAGDPSLDDVPATVIAAVEPDEVRPGDRAFDVSIEPLTAQETAELAEAMIGRPVAPDWAADLAASCAGRPRLIALAVGAATEAAGDRIESIPPRELVGGEIAAAARRLLERRASRLGEPERELAGALAALGGSGPVAELAALLERDVEDIFVAATDLAAADLVVVAGEVLRLPSRAHVEAAEAALPSRRRRELHRRALQLGGQLSPERRARHLLAAGPANEAAEAALEAASTLAARADFEAALELARAALDRGQGRVASEAELLIAEIALALGRYDEAMAAAERAARSRDAERRCRAHIALARARHKSGDLDGAEEALLALLDRFPDDMRGRGAYARLLVSRGRFDRAAEVAGPIEIIAERGAAAPGDPLCLEAAGLARLYGGDLEGAGRAFDVLAARADDDALRGRVAALRGLLAHHLGEVARAAALYGEAAEAAGRAGEIHAAAVSSINRATAHCDGGRFADAIADLDRAIVKLRRIGRVAELPAALFNRGHALLQLGELEAARRAGYEALALAVELGTPQMELYARLLLGDVCRREGRQEDAEAAYRRALEVAGSSDRDALAARLNLAELAAERGDVGARRELELASKLARTAEERARALLSRARVCLRFGDDPGALSAAVEEAREAAAATGREDLAWRLASLGARLALAAGDAERARALARRARAEIEALLAATPESRRPGARSDPDIVALAGLEHDLELSGQRPGTATPAIDEVADLRRLLSLSRRLNSELRLEPLLDQVIDTAIELTGADRGFLLLSRGGPRDPLEVAVARNIGAAPAFRAAGDPGGELALSRSIAERAARTGEVVLTVDAAYDERFDTAESVAAMQLRSVLAVPLRRKSEVLGTIYVDHRFRAGAFDGKAVRLCRELADVAAVALANARLVEENRRRQQAIGELNRRLETELGEREKELAAVRSRLGPGEAAGERVPEIVGRAAPMVKMIELLERAAASSLPVVITGESGTGKELVARALHRLGPRSGAPFVAVNCGAVPETLLESELFGHVRGAFTGADRDRRGHFEVADGGTLFLDEIADTGAAMQSKLLRVLQEGELRRLGDEAVRPVDVRVVAASNRDLGELMRAGEFREDLYYRLNVLTIRVPPLRERIEDVPALAGHILERAEGAGELAPEALRILCRYGWPGNVRELENELARAAALAEDRIEPEHLSERLRGAVADGPADPEDLDIRASVEVLERRLIAAALERTGGNQTRAAELLGLSRYGLQKKLKRYRL
jgi:transcriptional regulator with GAF, ATPase, and Fis domain